MNKRRSKPDLGYNSSLKYTSYNFYFLQMKMEEHFRSFSNTFGYILIVGKSGDTLGSSGDIDFLWEEKEGVIIWQFHNGWLAVTFSSPNLKS